MAGIDAIGGASSVYNAPSYQTPTQAAPETRTVEAPEAPERKPESDGNQAPLEYEITDSGSRNNQSADTTEALKKAVDEINSKAKYSEAQFAVHEGTNRIMVKIVDKTTKEVIKELPPEKTLDMIAKAWELAGLMVDEKR